MDVDDSRLAGILAASADALPVANPEEAHILARVLLKARCIIVTGQENQVLAEAMHMMWAPTPDDALSLAIHIAGDPTSVTVIPNGVGVIFS